MIVSRQQSLRSSRRLVVTGAVATTTSCGSGGVGSCEWVNKVVLGKVRYHIVVEAERG